jgi:hypothetical protein
MNSMARADSIDITPASASDQETYPTPLREHLIDGFALAFILVMASILGCVVADHVSDKIAHRCAVDLQEGLR